MFKIHTASEWFEEYASGYVLVSDRWVLEIGLVSDCNLNYFGP